MQSVAATGTAQVRNHLLAAIPASELAYLRRLLEPVTMTARESIFTSGAIITHIYFVEEGLISLVQPLTDGAAVEVGIIGREGFAGSPLVLGAFTSPTDATVQIKGSGLRIAAKSLPEVLENCPQLHALMLRFTHALHIQISQTAACNSRHNLQQRLARWILSARDRSDSDEMALSHELLATMLGLRRAGVTVALGMMKAQGLISNTHGRIQVLDRAGIEKTVCECYGVVRNEYRRLAP